MAWHEISITCEKNNVESITAALETAGALAVTYKDGEDNPVFEPKPKELLLWEKMIVTGLFPIDRDIAKISQKIHQQFPSSFIAYQPLQDKDWETVWTEHFHPQQFGHDLWICPSNTDSSTLSGTVVQLDPGMAFGTGQHPTTRLCLNWLGTQSLTHKTILDFGCGTSILAIAALKRGAVKAYGIDHDEQAIISSLSNAEKNNISNDQLILSLSADETIPACDIVIANILMNPLISLSNTIADLCAPKGMLLLSGILENQIAPVMESYAKWFTFKPFCLDEGWVLLSATKHS